MLKKLVHCGSICGGLGHFGAASKQSHTIKGYFSMLCKIFLCFTSLDPCDPFFLQCQCHVITWANVCRVSRRASAPCHEEHPLPGHLLIFNLNQVESFRLHIGHIGWVQTIPSVLCGYSAQKCSVHQSHGPASEALNCNFHPQTWWPSPCN